MALTYELMTSLPPKVVEAVDDLIGADPWPTAETWGMGAEAAAAAARAEEIAGGQAPLRDPNAPRPVPASQS